MTVPVRQSQPLRRPLIGLALVYIAGTWGAVMIGGLPPAWLGAASACLLILSLVCHGGVRLLQRRRPVASVFDPVFPVLPRLISGLSTLCLYLAAGAIAWCAADTRLEDPSPNALSALMEKPRESVEVEGVIADDPVVRPLAGGERQLWSFPLRLEEIRRVIPWQKARGTVQVILPAPLERHRPRYGERWRLAGVLTDNARFPEENFAPEDMTRPLAATQYNAKHLWNAQAQLALFFREAMASRDKAGALGLRSQGYYGVGDWLPHSTTSLHAAKILNIRDTEGAESLREKSDSIVAMVGDTEFPQSKIKNLRSTISHSVANSCRPVLDWLNRRYTFRAEADTAVCLVPQQGSPLMEVCFRFRRKFADTLARGIDHRPDVAGLLQALLLGYRQELPEKLRNDFTVTGTYHIFAISGQHVAILSLFIIVILQSYRVSRVKWFLYVAPLLVVFTVSTGMSSSAVRGCLMALLCFLGPLVGRKPDIPSAMALAALIILAADPFQLFDYGFLLSFVAVTGLIVLCPPMLQQVAPAVEPDPLRLQPEPKPVHWGRRSLRAVVFLGVTSLAAWLVTMPLVARWFNLASPVALLANLIVIPVTTLVLLAGCLSIVFGLAVPVLGEIFNFANVALVSFLLWVTDLMARIPCGHVFVRSPPIWSVTAWYVTLAAWGVWRQWTTRGAWQVWLVGPILLVLALGAGLIGSWNAVEVDILNLGDHPACFVNIPGGDDGLIDPGSHYQVRKVIRHLRRQGVDRLKAVVLTGADSARAAGTPELLQSMPVKELWLPPGGEHSRALRETLEIAHLRGVVLRPQSDQTRFPLLRQEVLWPWSPMAPSKADKLATGRPILRPPRRGGFTGGDLARRSRNPISSPLAGEDKWRATRHKGEGGRLTTGQYPYPNALPSKGEGDSGDKSSQENKILNIRSTEDSMIDFRFWNLDFGISMPPAGRDSSSAWLLRRGAVSVLYMDAVSTQLAAVVREQIPDLKPTVLVENRMEVKPKQEEESLGAMGIQPEWRVICTRALLFGNEGDLPLRNRFLRLPPGQGMRVRLDKAAVRLERLSP